MAYRAAISLWFLGCWFYLCPVGRAAGPQTPIDYSRHVQPILAERCFACHGPDESSRQAGLRLDQPQGGLQPADSGQAAIVPGEPLSSQLWLRVSSADDDVRMPPADSGPPLSDKQTAVLRRWIEEGAAYTTHWSFRPLVRPGLPAVRDAGWPRQAIDRFVLASLEDISVAPSPEAGKKTLLRRLSLDLLGLPPAPEEVAEWLAEDHPDGYERLVDRLLASPHFGERFARHWLDLAHYADSDGYLGDALRPYAWRYRDWVIQAINGDLPLDQFAIEQLAGDLLPKTTLRERTATGFLRNTLRNTEAGVDLEEYRVKEIVDRVSTLGTAWLGLSLGCAECHAHKYDPLSQREFYELFAFFNDADDVDLPSALPGLQEAYEANLEQWSREHESRAAGIVAAWSSDSDAAADDVLAACDVEAKKRSAEQKKLLEMVQKSVPETLAKQLQAYEKHASQKPRQPSPKVMTIASRQVPRATFVHVRGDYRRPGEAVTPGTPSVLPPLKPRGETADRLDLARWLVDPQHPLTPRVTVNYLWKHLFGQAIVGTVDNFGAGGEAPSHPDLLDWLASELPAKHMSRKALVRLIVTSATYRQSSVVRPALDRVDPLNKLLGRQNRFRLEAEAVRDMALAASGLLTRAIGGEGVRPPQPAYVTNISRNADWPVSTGGDLYRRGMYIVFRRATPYPMLLTFDAPDSTFACSRRERSNSPLQALTLLNDPVFFTAAQTLGRELAAAAGRSDQARVGDAFARCLGRKPTSAEELRVIALLDEQRSHFQRDETAARAVAGPDLLPAAAFEQAAWIVVARTLLNLDEFITRE